MPGNDSYTKLLLPNNGIDTSAVFIDFSESNHVITTNGTAQIDTAQSKFGGASGLFDGDSDYLTIPNSADFNFGSGDFTVDFWVRFNSVSSIQVFLGRNLSSDRSWVIYFNNSSATLRFAGYWNGTTQDTGWSWSPSINTWYHIAVVRNGVDLKAFIDGTQIGSTYNISTYTIRDSSTDFYIGDNVHPEGTYYFNGWMDEIRISKGIARWTSNFTPSTEAYTSEIPYIYYKCDDNLATTVVLDNTGHVNGTASVNTNNLSIVGKVDSAFEFNGTDERVSFSTPNRFLGANSRSIAFWVKYTVNDSNYHYPFNYGITGSAGEYFGVYIYQGKLGFTQWGFGLETTSTYNDGNWHFVVITWDGTTAKFYVDLNLLQGNTTVNTPDSTFYIAYNIYTSTYAPCSIDEFRIYSSVLSLSDIEDLYYLSETLDISDTINLSDSWELLTNPEQQSISDTINLDDSWELQTNPDNISIPDNVVIDDTWELLTNPQILDIPFSSSYTPSIVQNTKYETTSGVTSVPFVLSSSPIPDNILIVFIGYSSWIGSGGDKTITPPSSDWRLVDKEAYGNAGLAVYWYKVKPGDGTSFTFNLDLSADYLSGIIYEITDINNDNPINQHSIITGSSGITRITSPVTPSVLNTLALSACAINRGLTNGVSCSSVSAGFTLDVLAESSYHSSFSSYKNALTSDLITPITNTFTLSGSPAIDETSIASMLLLNADNGVIIALDDDWFIDLTGTFITKFTTKLYTKLQNIKTFFTDLRVTYFSIKKFNTKLYLKHTVDTFYSTDLRVRYRPDESLVAGPLDDFLVKLDGIELTDVDYNTLNISLNLNTTPSQAQFTLSRRHDDLDRKLDGSASVITAQNKIEVFDGTIKLFTGYISEIDANSSDDTVRVIAEDVRRKLSSLSMELEYGGDYFIDSNHNGIPDKDDPDTTVDQYKFPDYIYFSKNIGTAFAEVIAAIGSYLSGCDVLPFTGSFVPEYVKSYNDYVSLIDELLRQTANVNWYIDENERLKFQVIGVGTTTTYVDLSAFNTMKPHLVVPIIWTVGGGGEVITRSTEFGAVKTLNLASLNSKRGLYDLIAHDVHLNKIPIEYAQSYNVKCGKEVQRKWFRKEFVGWMDTFIAFVNGLDEKTTFSFQQWGFFHNPEWYIGMNTENFGYAYSADEWVIRQKQVVQWLDPKAPKTGNKNLPDIVVGSGLPRKTIYLESYGVKNVSGNLWENKYGFTEWGEAVRDYGEYVDWGLGGPSTTKKRINEDSTWLVEKTEESYNRIAFLTDLANFMLSQNNKPITTANVSMILDAYEYYNLSLKNLINLSNTIQANIYNNNNGFPLNIDSVRINCADRTVSLSLTNYGKTFYAKAESYIKGYKPPTQKWIMTKESLRGRRG